MSREIKFRAWDILRNQYINLNDSLCSTPYYELFCHTPDSRAMELEQWTGLKDASGVEIYEGDVVRTVYGERVFSVGWGIAKFTLYNARGRYCDLRDMPTESITVIGNRHEHPELLEVSK